MDELTPTYHSEDLRERIMAFEEELLRHPQIEIPVKQYFCNGVYLRRVDMPAGALVTGRIHKFPCLNIIMKGAVEVVTDQGAVLYRAPVIFESPAGAKRALRVIEDCTWVTAHPNPENKRRPAHEMMERLTCASFDDPALMADSMMEEELLP